ncbi:MAG: MarR family transcriptional regulator [Nocardiopsaceae bacterium]|nr:MarR family transcriptional regulator [Nocardiopsaceae bacterium]
MQSNSRTANLLGATALAVTDLALAGATAAAGTSPSGAAALVVLSGAGGLSVTELGRRVGLSQSAAARMTDSLEGSGLVTRRPGPGRRVTVEPTPAGRQAAAHLLSARAAPLDDVLAALDEDEQRTLAALLAKLLARLYGEIGDNELMCRLCDRPACTAGATCPVGEARHCRDSSAGP